MKSWIFFPLLILIICQGLQTVSGKPGSCPQIHGGIPKLGICADQCQEDSQCPGERKCCRNGCGKLACTDPVQ